MATLFDVDPAALDISVRGRRDRFAVSGHNLACRHDRKEKGDKVEEIGFTDNGEGAKDLSVSP